MRAKFLWPSSQKSSLGKEAKESSKCNAGEDNFLENLMVAVYETLITYERPRGSDNRQEVVRHRWTTVVVCCLLM